METGGGRRKCSKTPPRTKVSRFKKLIFHEQEGNHSQTKVVFVPSFSGRTEKWDEQERGNQFGFLTQRAGKWNKLNLNSSGSGLRLEVIE